MTYDCQSDRSGSVINSIGSIGGINTASASKLMAVIAAMVMAFLKRYTTKNRLDAGGLASLLSGQGDFLRPRLDNRLVSALGFPSVGAFLTSATGMAGRAADAAGALGSAAASAGGVAVAESRSALSRWWPWLLVAALAIILLPLLRSCGEQTTQKAVDTVGMAAKATADAAKATAGAVKEGAAAVTRAIKTIELPGGMKIDAWDGGFMASLVAFLNSKDAAMGKGYVFDDLHFDTASATIKAESTKQLEQLATVLKAYPSVAISVEGHTDNTGDAAANKTLSNERAAAVEKALEKLGIDDARITSAGYGPEKPIASNDTEQGRAQNRRVEVVVTKR